MSVDLAAVKAWLRIAPTDTAEDDLITAALNAAVAWVARLPVVVDTPGTVPDDTATWPVDVQQGTVMLTARTYRRRNSPGGIETFGESVTYVSRDDPDVARALGTGVWARPGIG